MGLRVEKASGSLLSDGAIAKILPRIQQLQCSVLSPTSRFAILH